MNENKVIVIALGGNAILQADEEGTYTEQIHNVRKAVSEIVKLVKAGYRIVLTHGNGPQIGNLYIQNSLAGEFVPPMPLDACTAMSQGLIGYFMQQELQNELAKCELDFPVMTYITQVLVNEKDPAFKRPTKPIGPFHNAKEAEMLMQKTSLVMKEDSKNRWRRVVPSPKPRRIVEKDVIKSSIENGAIVIAAGGGGIPVIKENETYVGVEAVIDKDLTACVLATEIKADILLILTDIDRVALHFNTPKQKWLDSISLDQAGRFMSEGHFKEGSMKPKMEAGIKFVKNGGERSIIASLFSAHAAVKGKSGTIISHK